MSAVPLNRAGRTAVRASAEPGFGETAFLTAALFGQQDAFFNIVRIIQGHDSADAATTVSSDPLNMASVALTFGGLAYLFYRRPALLGDILGKSRLILILSFYVLASSIWSDAPSLSLKRAAVQLNTVMLALYIPARLGFDGAARLVARAIAICALASVFTCLAFPRFGVMHQPGFEGKWRGVYTHKNSIAQAMALGATLQYYVIIKSRQKVVPILILLLEALIIVRASSATVLGILGISSLAYGIFWILHRGGPLRALTLTLAPLLIAGALVLLIVEPQLFKALSGRDATLTGRTELWSWVVHEIPNHPVLGHGYQAFWDSGGPVASKIWYAIGWSAPNSHNGLLEVALELGLMGEILLIFSVLQGLIRITGLFQSPATHLQAVASLILTTAILLESGTEAVLLRQGDIDWLMLNLLSFAAANAVRRERPRARAEHASILARARPLST